ncbi:hypothetical protein Val02_78510 [Virgisporangium aliadipatigenens]|uniref:WD40 repeat domain-containing protein n=1 Tax=Virgisporangium aliadipatigenens TaxID=741659 RepID=A0A8J4DU59_9ACTN|nr:hypothetical protein [Virgisporangium aliadipatigenens]GIJ50965.1 hypothetical protein Val02_78510 [Virgisporangium aliadipatigenens]
MDEISDDRARFAHRLRSLREAAGLSVRRLEVESARTPRRHGQPPVRLKRSTIADMVSRSRPVRPEPANFEVFVDTCLRVAAEQRLDLPDDLTDRAAWDDAYRQLRDHVDRHPRPESARRSRQPARLGSAPPAPDEVPAGDDATPAPQFTRRRITVLASVLLAGAAVPLTLRRFLASADDRDPGAAPGGPGGYRAAGTLLSPAIGLDNPVWSVSLGTLDGAPLAVVGRADGTVQLWNPATGAARGIPLTGHQKPVFSIALRPPIAVSASVDGTLRLWDLLTDPPASVRMGEPLAGSINSVALGTVEGATVAVTGGDDRTLRVWEVAPSRATGAVVGTRLDTEITSVAASTLHGTMMAVSGSTDGTVWLWDIAARRGVQPLGAHRAAVWAMTTGVVDGRTIAVSGSEDGEIRSWDLTAPVPGGRRLGQLRVAVKTLAIGRIGHRTVVLSGSDDGLIRVWDPATGALYGDGLTGPAKAAESIALGEVGGRPFVVAGHWDGTIWTWSP